MAKESGVPFWLLFFQNDQIWAYEVAIFGRTNNIKRGFGATDAVFKERHFYFF